MGRSSTVTDPDRKKEYWEDDFNTLEKEVGKGRLKLRIE